MVSHPVIWLRKYYWLCETATALQQRHLNSDAFHSTHNVLFHRLIVWEHNQVNIQYSQCWVYVWRIYKKSEEFSTQRCQQYVLETESCHHDNFVASLLPCQWRQCWHQDNSPFSSGKNSHGIGPSWKSRCVNTPPHWLSNNNTNANPQRNYYTCKKCSQPIIPLILANKTVSIRLPTDVSDNRQIEHKDTRFISIISQAYVNLVMGIFGRIYSHSIDCDMFHWLE